MPGLAQLQRELGMWGGRSTEPALGTGPALLPHGQGGQGGHTGKLPLGLGQPRTPCRALEAEQRVSVPLWGGSALLVWLRGSAGLWGELGASHGCWSRPPAEMGCCAGAPLPPPPQSGALPGPAHFGWIGPAPAMPGRVGHRPQPRPRRDLPSTTPQRKRGRSAIPAQERPCRRGGRRRVRGAGTE